MQTARGVNPVRGRNGKSSHGVNERRLEIGDICA